MISSQFQSLWNSQPPSNNISRHLLVKSDDLLICVGKNFSLRWETGELWRRSWQKKKSGYVRRTNSVIFELGTSQGLCSTLRVGVYLTNIGIIVAVKIDLGYWPTKADKLSPLLWSQRQKKKDHAQSVEPFSPWKVKANWSSHIGGRSVNIWKNMWTKSIEDNNEEQTLWLQTEIVKTKTTTIEDRNEWRCLSFLCLFRLACYWHVLSNIYGWSETSHWEMM